MRLADIGVTEHDVALIRDWAIVIVLGLMALLVLACMLGLAVRLFIVAGGL